MRFNITFRPVAIPNWTTRGVSSTSLHVCRKVQRLIPALLLMARNVMENVTVKVTYSTEGFVTFQKGARVVVDVIAIRECHLASFLCLLLRDWKLEIVLKEGETEMEYEERVLGKASLVGNAFGLGSVPIRLSRRH
ncbi:hypothetical protein C8R44DRAFT_782965 [Mycena epipterygia]|nr:hypothetical protein C8R44DRAFT_782965 [Mycena epipterygia]